MDRIVRQDVGEVALVEKPGRPLLNYLYKN
jgi:hypothetical protein